MTWYPIAFLPPQYVDSSGKPYSGAVLKCYSAETNTPIPMAVSFLGTTTATSFTLNASGYVAYSGAVIIPHVQENFKAALYPTQAAADANSGAIWTYDDVQIAASNSTSFFQSFSGDGTTVAFTLSQDLGTDENAIKVFVDNGLTEHATNGAMASDTGWTKGAGWTIAAGVATATGAISTAISQNAGVTVNAGQAYVVTITITRSAGTLTPSVGGTAGIARSADGTYTELIVAGATQVLAFTGAGFTGTLDNVSVHRISSKGMDIYNPNQYTLVNTALTFTAAPLTGTNNIFVFADSSTNNAASSATAAANAATAAAVSETNAAADAVQTAADAVQTAADRVQTDADVVSATASAAAAASSAAGASGMPCAAAGGTANAITATYSPAITLVDQRIVALVASAANTSTTPTFAPNGLTAHTITKQGGAALAAGDIPGALAVCLLEYNLAHTRWELINPANTSYRGAVAYITGTQSIPNATDTLINFDSESIDTDGIHSTSANTSRMTVPAGITKIRLMGQLQIADTADNTHRGITFYKNGSPLTAPAPGTNIQTSGASENVQLQCTSSTLGCTAGDYFEMSVNQSSGGSINAQATYTWFEMQILG